MEKGNSLTTQENILTSENVESEGSFEGSLKVSNLVRENYSQSIVIIIILLVAVVILKISLWVVDLKDNSGIFQFCFLTSEGLKSHK